MDIITYLIILNTLIEDEFANIILRKILNWILELLKIKFLTNIS